MPNNPPYPNVLGAKWLRHAQIWRENRNCYVKTFFKIKTLPTYSPYFCNMQYCRKQGFHSLRRYVYTVGKYTGLPSCSLMRLPPWPGVLTHCAMTCRCVLARDQRFEFCLTLPMRKLILFKAQGRKYFWKPYTPVMVIFIFSSFLVAFCIGKIRHQQHKG